jgi:hypothetical protein
MAVMATMDNEFSPTADAALAFAVWELLPTVAHPCRNTLVFTHAKKRNLLPSS